MSRKATGRKTILCNESEFVRRLFKTSALEKEKKDPQKAKFKRWGHSSKWEASKGDLVLRDLSFLAFFSTGLIFVESINKDQNVWKAGRKIGTVKNTS